MLDYIFLDMDGVLCDFWSAAVRAFGHDPTKVSAENRANGSMEEWLCGGDREEFWRVLDRCGHEFWLDLRKYEWTLQLCNAARHIAPTYVCSMPPKHPQGAMGKLEWIQSKLPAYFDKRYIFCQHKSVLAGPNRVLIDDWVKNVSLWKKHGGIGLLFKQPWSSSGLDFDEVVEALKELDSLA